MSEQLEPIPVTPIEFLNTITNNQFTRVHYDIETGPQPPDTIRPLFDESEIKLPKHPGDFDPREVKYGNTKDAAKRKAKLNDERNKHRALLSSWASNVLDAKQAAWKKFCDNATTHPLLCNVIAIGYTARTKDGIFISSVEIDPEDELTLLYRFWQVEAAVRRGGGKMLSWHGHFFDLPMLMRRTWIKGLQPPQHVFDRYSKPQPHFVDIARVWAMGSYDPKDRFLKLNTLARVLQTKKKIDGLTGEMFHVAAQQDLNLAYDYLLADVVAVADLDRRLELHLFE